MSVYIVVFALLAVLGSPLMHTRLLSPGDKGFICPRSPRLTSTTRNLGSDPVQIVLNTSPEVGDLQEVMGHIYSSLYVEYVVKSPLHSLGDPIA